MWGVRVEVQVFKREWRWTNENRKGEKKKEEEEKGETAAEDFAWPATCMGNLLLQVLDATPA